MSRLVLVADDSPTHQRRAQGILTGEGLEVVTVSNGVAAIKKLPGINPTLVLADVSMPGRDGYEVCDYVKNSPDLARVPVLLIYSDLEPFDEVRAQRVRADGRIKKPFGQDELLAIVHRFLPEAEEAAPPPPPPPVAEEPSFVTEPVDLAPAESARVETPELGALSESAAFGEQFMPEAAAVPQVAPPPIVEELPSFPTPTMEELAAAAPEAEIAGEEESGVAEPVLEEEAAQPAAAEEPSPGGSTMIFRMPVEIAEPILAEDQGPAAPVEEAAAPASEIPAAEEEGVGASTLESYTLTEAAAGEVSIAPPAPEVPPPPPEEVAAEAPAEAEAPPPSALVEEAPAPAAAPEPAPEAATSAAAVLDTDLVYWIVHNVVVRMAPPALATSTVEALIRQITDEMINELTQPPPEPQG